MVAYKLYYFDLRGGGETIRLIFHYANIPFEDCRISLEDWPKIKPTTPTGKVPYLEVDGKSLPESGAILRYLGKKFGLVSSDEWENAQMEYIFEYFKDFLMEIKSYFQVTFHQIEGDKDQIYKDVYLPAAEKAYKKVGEVFSKSTSGFLANTGITWADLLLAESTLTLKGMDSEFEKRWPFMIEHQKRVHSIPQLQKYLESRKPSPV
uniref:Glutathione S-transferase n=1 Tax=Panagrolaimus sp. PS1159 TaxID=55785 RepID=A0AC35ET66_9BILA